MNPLNKILGTKSKSNIFTFNKKVNTRLPNINVSKMNMNLPSFNFNTIKPNQPVKNGASIEMQNKWKNASIPQRNIWRQQYKDSDGDRVPNSFDCQPFNPIRQDSGEYDDILQKYSCNPYNKFGKGACADAAQEIVTRAKVLGVPDEDIKVYGYTKIHPIRGGTSQHVVAKVRNTIYDPTATQYGKNELMYESENPNEEYTNIQKFRVNQFVSKDILKK